MTSMTLPYLQALRDRTKNALVQIEAMPGWDPTELATYFRQAMLGGIAMDTLVLLPHEPIDLTTFTILDHKRDAPLHAGFQAASNAAAAAQLLFESMPDAPLEETMAIARRLYTDAVVLRAQGAVQLQVIGVPVPSVDDFKRTALRCMLQLGESAPSRPWSVLIPADARWSLAAPASTRAQLHRTNPETRAWLDAFELQLQFFSPTQALDKIWALDAPNTPSPEERTVLALPDLGM